MAPIFVSLLLTTFISGFISNHIPSFASAKVLIVVMEDEPVITYKASTNHVIDDDYAQKYKEKVISRHDIFLESILPLGSYTKLYSYTHLLNGFALHTLSEETVEVLHGARGIRIIQEDIKMVKMTTHTPDYLGIPSSVWPLLGGAEHSGEGVVIGLVDTGINPDHPSFSNLRPGRNHRLSKFKGNCEAGNEFPVSACNGKIVGAQHFARAAIATGDFNASHDYASAFDGDGHGSHTASTAAGNYRVAVLSNGYNYGYASGMAPGASVSAYKAIFSSGGYMSDVVAAVDKAVEDGVDVLSLSIGPSTVPPGPASFLNILEMELLLATKAGVFVVQAAGNAGPGPGSILSFSPWIMTVAASTTDRKYNNTVRLGSGHSLSGYGLSPPTADRQSYPLAAAEDVCSHNESYSSVQSCLQPEPFIPSLAWRKIIICSFTIEVALTARSIDSIVDTIRAIGASGFILTLDRSLDSEPLGDASFPLSVPGTILTDRQAAQALWEYYDANTMRGITGGVVSFGATARIEDGRNAIYGGGGPVVASYSSRGPDVNNAYMQLADVLKPNVMAPGSSIWAAWSPRASNEHYVKGQEFAVISGTSMATPHVAGVAALIKQRHPHWSPAAIASAIMTTADVTDSSGLPLLAQTARTIEATGAATPFDYGAGFINPGRAVDPGLIFDIEYKNYVQFLCAVPGVDDESVKRSVGTACPRPQMEWCSDLNTPSVTVADLIGSRRVYRRVTSVTNDDERYRVVVHEPAGVGVTVTPQAFTISPNTTRVLRLELVARDVTNAYAFGEVVLHGDQRHQVRIPLAIFVTSTINA